jgi:hypothetical protein
LAAEHPAAQALSELVSDNMHTLPQVFMQMHGMLSQKTMCRVFRTGAQHMHGGKLSDNNPASSTL